jgi:hypothetical protein
VRLLWLDAALRCVDALQWQGGSSGRLRLDSTEPRKRTVRFGGKLRRFALLDEPSSETDRNHARHGRFVLCVQKGLCRYKDDINYGSGMDRTKFIVVKVIVVVLLIEKETEQQKSDFGLRNGFGLRSGVGQAERQAEGVP